MAGRQINSKPLKYWPRSLFATAHPFYPTNEVSYIGGQAAAIRFFDPNSKADYQSMKSILEGRHSKKWLDDPKLSLKEYRDWAGTETPESFLFAVHDARQEEKKAALAVRGYVYIYSDREEKFRIKRLEINGFLAKNENRRALEVSFALKPGTGGKQMGSGLMSSSLRQSCLQVRSLLNSPKQADLKLFAFTDPDNESAAHTLKASGFIYKGKMLYDADSEGVSDVYVLSWRQLHQKIKGKLLEAFETKQAIGKIEAVPFEVFPQITDSHCGPAMVQSFLHFYNIEVTQDQAVEAAQAKSRLNVHGMQPQHLAKAITILAPDLKFYFKEDANIGDLERLIKDLKLPVGVNWQGLFYDTLKEEKLHNPHGEHGHYSVMVKVNKYRGMVYLADPYPDYNKVVREFNYAWFKTRWWDIDRFKNRKQKKRITLRTKRLLFVIVPKTMILPEKLKLKQY